MTTPDYRKPRAAYDPLRCAKNASILVPIISLEEVQGLTLAIPGLGNVQIATASLHASRYVFSWLLDQCESVKARKVREELLKDTSLDMGHWTFWFWVLNELARADVALPVVREQAKGEAA